MSNNAPRELDRRDSAGVRVSLWWSPAGHRTWVNVSDHPYAYAARRGIPTTARAVVA